MRIVGITEASIHEPWIEYSSHLIEKEGCSFCTLHGLLSSGDQFLHTAICCFVEVHDTQVIETTEYIKVNLTLHELQLWVERIIPNNIAILDSIPIFRVPVEVLSNEFCIPEVHLNHRYVFIHQLNCWFTW